jgi:hypothetical protein
MRIGFETVKNKFPEARVVQASTGIEYNVHCRVGNHSKGGNYKMYINPEKGLFHCHDCGSTGDATRTFFPETEYAFPSMRIDRDPTEVSNIISSVTVKRSGPTLENNVPSPGVLVPLSKLESNHPAIEYLSSRGFDMQEILSMPVETQLYYVKDTHQGGSRKTRGRIIFPVRSCGLLVGWQGRIIERAIDENTREVWDGAQWIRNSRGTNGKWTGGDENPKYLTCPGMQRGKVLYGLDSAKVFAKQSGKSEVIITEGPLDALRTGPRAVATFGSVTPTQKRIIASYFDTVIVLLDPEIKADAPDPKVKKKFVDLTSDWQGLKCVHLHLPDGKDPGATPRSVINHEIEKAMGLC